MTFGNHCHTRTANTAPRPNTTTSFEIQIGFRECPRCSELPPNPGNSTNEPQTDRYHPNHTTNTDLDAQSAPIKTIFRRPPVHPRPQANNKEQSDERISKFTGPISSNSRKRCKTPTKLIDQVDRRNTPRRRIILLAGNNNRLYKSHQIQQ